MNLFHQVNIRTQRPVVSRCGEGWRWVATWLMLTAGAVSALAAGPGLRQSKHNLALANPARSIGGGESDLCKFCHTPHGSPSQKALWNHADSGATYIPYSSSTMKAVVGQPTGDSKLCLSCHDGTVALGTLHKQKLNSPTRIASARMSPGRSVIGTDLSDDHPISFNYDAALTAGAELRDPSVLNNRVRLDASRQVQCTSCHDAHNDKFGKFLVVDNFASGLCLTCHNPKFWNTSSHRNSSRTWNGLGRDPWPHSDQKTVAANGCENCHTSHQAGTRQRLLISPQAEESCLVCHNGSASSKDLAREFNKPSVHPVMTTASLHDGAEDPLNSKSRHASCVDCHNPHAANGTPALRPNIGGALAGVPGVNASGSVVKTVTREYELCFRCHADTAVKGSSDVLRQWSEANTRLQFAPANSSFHPVIAAGKNPRVPSLIAPWTAASFVLCTDCHNNDQGPEAGGAGPRGPHGSLFKPLLERNMVTQDFQAESPSAYALCYKCHSRSSILSDASFAWHRKHVVDAKTACTTCHDSHGVAGNPNLINFNTLYVKPSPTKGPVRYVPFAREQACTLTCHGVDHPVSRK